MPGEENVSEGLSKARQLGTMLYRMGVLELNEPTHPAGGSDDNEEPVTERSAAIHMPALRYHRASSCISSLVQTWKYC